MSTAMPIPKKPKPLTKFQKQVIFRLQAGEKMTRGYRSGIYRIISDDGILRVSGSTFDILRAGDYIKMITDPEKPRDRCWVYARPGENQRIRNKESMDRKIEAIASRIAEEYRVNKRNRRWRMAVLAALQCTSLLSDNERLNEVFRLIVCEIDTGNIPQPLSMMGLGLEIPPLPESGHSDG